MWDSINNHPLLKIFLQAIVGIIVLVLAFLLRSQLLAAFMPFAVALTFAYILNPVVIWLQQRKVNRTVAVVLIYFAFSLLLFAILAQFIPMVVSEVNQLAKNIPNYVEQAQQWLKGFNQAAHRLALPQSVRQAIVASLDELETVLVSYLTRVPEFTVDMVRGIFNTVLVMILTFYLLRDFDGVKKNLHALLPRKHRQRMRTVLHQVDDSLGDYIRGQVLIAAMVGFSTYLGLLFLGVDFALLLGIIAGITNIIPYLGPFLGAAPAVLVALLTSPALALKTAIVITIIQQLESNLLVPQVLGKRMGLSPVVVLMAILVGGQLLGIIGMIIAVPVVSVARILHQNFKSSAK